MATFTSTEKGGIAELAIASEAARLGIVVSRPMIEGRRYDLIFDIDGVLLRVQCKWAPRVGEVVRINSRTSRRARLGHVRGTYSAEEVTRSPAGALSSRAAMSSRSARWPATR